MRGSRWTTSISRRPRHLVRPLAGREPHRAEVSRRGSDSHGATGPTQRLSLWRSTRRDRRVTEVRQVTIQELFSGTAVSASRSTSAPTHGARSRSRPSSATSQASLTDRGYVSTPRAPRCTRRRFRPALFDVIDGQQRLGTVHPSRTQELRPGLLKSVLQPTAWAIACSRSRAQAFPAT